jgi:hypothetical protein
MEAAMAEKNGPLTAFIELAGTALVIYMQVQAHSDASTKASILNGVARGSRWAAERLGRLAIAAENAYNAEVRY